ncbi:hypothetical protein [Nitrosovibrio sp. Nv4]|uniref:hypothetical protein n=1 Tax=Nitrosovibrio sp. Nv4 TaxID=1945880 RepID=UPI000BCB34D4|nr:hypothetical protein [Nitrosovibrio sp. Nv4]SOD39881.1 hypothetical protein SAMN06298226_0112 [Nitrosovibrio sp. Nv4]
MKSLLGILAIVFATTAFAKAPTMKLNCAKIPGYKTEVERQYLNKASGGGDIYNVQVTFITKRPDDKLTDKALRECIAKSLTLDGKKDILATAWFRPMAGTNSDDDEQISPYGSLKYISYTASTKSVEVHSMQLRKK